MKDCPNCEYHKQRAQLWRHEAYKLSGHPLDWEPDLMQRTWVGLTQTEVVDLLCEYNKLTGNVGWQQLIYMTEAKLKEKNNA